MRDRYLCWCHSAESYTLDFISQHLLRLLCHLSDVTIPKYGNKTNIKSNSQTISENQYSITQTVSVHRKCGHTFSNIFLFFLAGHNIWIFAYDNFWLCLQWIIHAHTIFTANSCPPKSVFANLLSLIYFLGIFNYHRTYHFIADETVSFALQTNVQTRN